MKTWGGDVYEYILTTNNPICSCEIYKIIKNEKIEIRNDYVYNKKLTELKYEDK